MQSKARIVVLTGDGKGKTTSALGMVLRGVGHGFRCSIIQFMKKRADIGEVEALKRFPEVEITQCGLGFVPQKENPNFQKHCDAANEGLSIAHIKISDSLIKMIVLDEICGSLAHGLIRWEDVESLLENCDSNKIVICTGRSAPQELIELADTASRIEDLKHGYAKGIEAQKGVEF